jgi:glyoxylase-like metal-dependent hydrolase (beta-lactamase superfamily II)
MRIHHLSCGTLCPYGGRLVTGSGGFTGAEICCHCLLIETGESLVLVDTGMGLDDMDHPARRLGLPFHAAFRVQANRSETARERIRALGLDPADVRDIVCTHLDLDHAGGLPDFPHAQVHVFEAEHHAATHPTLRERARYPRCHIEHGPLWRIHDTAPGGDEWFGFESIRVLPGVDPEVLMIPLPGHSRGHTAIAVRDGEGWKLHCGDAYFHRDEVKEPPGGSVGLRAFQTMMAADNRTRRANQERLRELAASHSDEVQLFCAHDPVELERARGAP